jgi:predicted transcriptional regulator YheO
LVDFLAAVMGPNVEVVLLDATNETHSIVAIRNPITDRAVGGPISRFALRLLQQAKKRKREFITNYLGKAYNNDRFLKSSTFFIRGDDGEIIGLMGVNTDLTPFHEAHRMLGSFLEIDEIADGTSESINDGENEDLIKETVCSVIDKVINSFGISPSRMTTEEKKDVVESLSKKGVFMLKGTVLDVANRLNVSEQTIYRYLK